MEKTEELGPTPGKGCGKQRIKVRGFLNAHQAVVADIRRNRYHKKRKGRELKKRRRNLTGAEKNTGGEAPNGNAESNEPNGRRNAVEKSIQQRTMSVAGSGKFLGQSTP